MYIAIQQARDRKRSKRPVGDDEVAAARWRDDSDGDRRVADLTAPEGFPWSVTLFGADPEQHYR
jgi:hypothetical protein